MSPRPTDIRELRSTCRKARRRHVCESCGGWIIAGDDYVDFAGLVEDRDFVTAKAHVACYELEQRFEGFGAGAPLKADLDFLDTLEPADRHHFMRRQHADPDRYFDHSLALVQAVLAMGRCHGGPGFEPFDLPGERA